MPRVKPGERKRAKRPKTRTGCRTCKIRRVKCDEAKPSCSRCNSTGRKCEGYDYLEPAAGEGSRSLSTVLPSSAFYSPEEQRAFQFFCERTSVELSGRYYSELWNCVVLQAAHTDPSIRHAVTALSSLHERYEQHGEVETTTGDFALKQYNLAITKHLDALKRPETRARSIDTYLASCMIFICIESLQGHFVSASQLVQGAIQLLYETHPGSDVDSAWPLAAFEALLCRLQAQCVGLFGPSARPKFYATRFLPIAHLSVPRAFESIAQARDFLDYYSWCYSFPDPSSNSFADHKAYHRSASFYYDLLKQWSSAFESLRASFGQTLSGKDRAAAMVLEIRQHMSAVSIDMATKYASQDDDELLWDAYHNVFSRVVELTAQVLHLSASPDKSGRPNTFTLDSGVLSTLYDIARVCRDPIIRRKAVDLLHHHPCREGLWDGIVAAQIAERVMLMEEASLARVDKASDIPTSARVSLVIPTFVSNANRPVVSYVSQPEPPNGNTLQELIGLEPVDQFGQSVLSIRSRSSPGSSSPCSPEKYA